MHFTEVKKLMPKIARSLMLLIVLCTWSTPAYAKTVSRKVAVMTMKELPPVQATLLPEEDPVPCLFQTDDISVSNSNGIRGCFQIRDVQCNMSNYNMGTSLVSSSTNLSFIINGRPSKTADIDLPSGYADTQSIPTAYRFRVAQTASSYFEGLIEIPRFSGVNAGGGPGAKVEAKVRVWIQDKPNVEAVIPRGRELSLLRQAKAGHKGTAEHSAGLSSNVREFDKTYEYRNSMEGPGFYLSGKKWDGGEDFDFRIDADQTDRNNFAYRVSPGPGISLFETEDSYDDLQEVSPDLLGESKDNIVFDKPKVESIFKETLFGAFVIRKEQGEGYKWAKVQIWGDQLYGAFDRPRVYIRVAVNDEMNSTTIKTKARKAKPK